MIPTISITPLQRQMGGDGGGGGGEGGNVDY